ncbi:MAG: hypothetical protein Q3M30_06940 [Candidatus Electrothrix sp. Rat3]|nr:hypothetical protein [Candidatus Electrothrix rattekaaiensis]
MKGARYSLLSRRMAGLAVFFFIVFPLAAQAGTQTPVVDGQYDEWDLDKDSSIPMRSGYNAGEVLPSVYLRYDSITNTVFVLVLQKDSMQDGKRKPVVNIYTLGQDIPVDINGAEKISNFSWVMNGGHHIGWEGSFQLTPGTYDCNAASHTLERSRKVSERKRASEVEVIDTKGLSLKCD